jgi:hypothetical protein
VRLEGVFSPDAVLSIQARRGFPSGMTDKNDEQRRRPQRLKPRCRLVAFGTAEAVPLTKPLAASFGFAQDGL